MGSSRGGGATAAADGSCLPKVGVVVDSDCDPAVPGTFKSASGAAEVEFVSSTSSVIPSSRRRRSDELDEVNDAAEGNSMVHRPRADSVNSEAIVNEKTVSWGVKASRTD